MLKYISFKVHLDFENSNFYNEYIKFNKILSGKSDLNSGV